MYKNNVIVYICFIQSKDLINERYIYYVKEKKIVFNKFYFGFEMYIICFWRYFLKIYIYSVVYVKICKMLGWLKYENM